MKASDAWLPGMNTDIKERTAKFVSFFILIWKSNFNFQTEVKAQKKPEACKEAIHR